MNNGKWITLKDGRRIFINTSKYMNSYIKNKGKKENIEELKNKQDKLAKEKYNLEEKLQKTEDDFYSGESDLFDEKELNDELKRIEDRIKEVDNEAEAIKKKLQNYYDEKLSEMTSLI